MVHHSRIVVVVERVQQEAAVSCSGSLLARKEHDIGHRTYVAQVVCINRHRQ